MDKEMSLSERIQRFRVINAINWYCEDWRKHDLYYTNEIILLYLDKDKISFEDKLNKMKEIVSKLEEEVKEHVPENIRKIGMPSFDCAREHLEKKIPKLEPGLELDVEYWCAISDIRGIEVLYDKELPKKGRNMTQLAYIKLIKFAIDLYGLDVKIALDGEEISD